ncbi:hypothetical protein PHET_01075 [Paragonimus heterotremus]|uniref:Uncharacterized protein n=1 Tax=Paragonimus heterotremus TaxID=100268 RepID=A0A8J4WKN2_9TREM|nr:hypothetical protein PHET_01075 [Paragonimus heterotremus]
MRLLATCLWQVQSCVTLFVETLKQLTYSPEELRVATTIKSNNMQHFSTSLESGRVPVVRPAADSADQMPFKLHLAHYFDLFGRQCLGARKRVFLNELQLELRFMDSAQKLNYDPAYSENLVRKYVLSHWSQLHRSKSPLFTSRRKSVEDIVNPVSQLLPYFNLLQRLCLNIIVPDCCLAADNSEEQIPSTSSEFDKIRVEQRPLVGPVPRYSQDVSYWSQRILAGRAVVTPQNPLFATLFGSPMLYELPVSNWLKAIGQTIPLNVNENELTPLTEKIWKLYKLESLLIPPAIDTATLGGGSRITNRTDSSKSVPIGSDLQIQVIDCLDCYTQHNGPILLMLMHQNVDMKRIRDQGGRTESRLVYIDDRMKFYQLINRFNKLNIQIQTKETEELGKSDSPGKQQTKTKTAALRKLEKPRTAGSQSGLKTQMETDFKSWLEEFTRIMSGARVLELDQQKQLVAEPVNYSPERMEANLANFTALRSLFSRNHFGGLPRKGPVQDYFLQLFHMQLILEEVQAVRV